MKKVVSVLLVIVLMVTLMGCANKDTNKEGENKMEGNIVVLETNMGNIEIQLAENMPITTGNFKKLVLEGVYDGVIFHRIIANFMIQGGDPTGTGMGDPSIASIEDEFAPGSTNVKGTIAMANRGPNTGSSQFFINLADNTYLDWDKPPEQSKHPAFGKVISGMEIVESMGKVKTGPGDKPVEDIKIVKAYIKE